MPDVYKGRPQHIERIDLQPLVQTAYQHLDQLAAQAKPVIIAFSGGKDSIVAAHLAVARLGVRAAVCETSFCFRRDVADFEKIAAHIGLNVTWTQRLDVSWLQKNPRVMFAEDQGLLYSCRQQAAVREIARARGIEGVIFGRRRQENPIRRPVYRLSGSYWSCNPLFDWRTEHVWQYIEDNGLPYPSIYDHPIGQLEGADPFVGVSLEKAARRGLNGFDLIHEYDNTVLPSIAKWYLPARQYLQRRAVLPMADIVRGMVDDGVNQADIMRRLGMEDEEIDRLIDRAGMPSRMARQATDFGKSWVPGE